MAFALQGRTNAVGVNVGVLVAVGVFVGVAVFVGVLVAVGVFVTVGVLVAVGEGVMPLEIWKVVLLAGFRSVSLSRTPALF